MCRKTLLAASLVVVLTTVPGPAMAQQGSATPVPPLGNEVAEPASKVVQQDSPADLAAIRATGDAFVTAFNEGNAKAVAKLWTADGAYVDDSGQSFVGRDAIEKGYADFFADNPGAHIRIIIDSLRLVGKSAAIEEGRAILDPPPPGAPAAGKYTADHVKIDGKWLMSQVRDSRVETPSAYNHVADLEFLIGTWTAEENGVKTKSVCTWVANKSFVQRNYTVTDVDGTSISGVQMIGWNAETGQVQSWDFSPDGGHAVGTWTPIANGWAAQVRGVTGEGVPTVAVNLLTRLDDNAYVWRSVNRMAGETALPDTDEVVIKRASVTQ